MKAKAILVTGVTGKQGRALVRRLFRASDFEVFGVSRNPNSASACSLSKEFPALKLIPGHLSNPAAIFNSIPQSSPIWGVYSVSPSFVSGLNQAREEREGKTVIDASIAHGVRHFVLSSVDRHGDTQSDTDETAVAHFQSKFRLEKYLQEQAALSATTSSPMTYTILGLPIFMENFTDDFSGRATSTTWKLGLDPSKKLQLISTADIAHFAYHAFSESESAIYNNKAISLAGGELTFEEANVTFSSRFGVDLPTMYDIVGRA
jgi:uncharacterized protein YbjT (DUF2867 family)